MKSKMRLSGNRTIIGIICIVLALGITFGIAPLVNKIADRKIDVVVMKNKVERGHMITEEDVVYQSVGAQNLSSKTITNAEAAVGKYASTTLYPSQILISDQVTAGGNSADEVLNSLNGTKVAISVNAGTLANIVSDKIENGDIVSAIVYDKTEDKYYTPAALKYLQVITTTTSEGVDMDEKTNSEQSVTVTLLVTPDQAELLARYNSTTTIHFALVCRGDKEIAGQFIQAQDEYLNSHPVDETGEEDDG